MAKEWARAFYHSAAWHKVRDTVKRKAHGMCQQCGRPCNGEVHHKTWLTPYNINNTAITLNQDNLIYLCHDCHCEAHGIFGKTQQDDVDYHFDSDGNVIPNNTKS